MQGGGVNSAFPPLRRIARKAALAACAAIGITASAPLQAASLKLPYSSPFYRMGSSANDSASVLSTTAKLAFPGMTLDDIASLVDDGYVFGATQCGTSWDQWRAFQARDVLVCRNPQTDAITMISLLFVGYHDSHTKSVAVELTDGDGGVYARSARAQYLSRTNNSSFAFVEPDGNGGVIYSCDTSKAGKAAAGTVASYNGGGYGFCSLTLMKIPKTSARSLAFANAPGEPALTVEDLKDYSFSSLFCGSSIYVGYLGSVAMGYNPTILETDGNGRATRMSVDFQIVEGNYTKCVAVEFTDGEGGVYAQAIRTLHGAKSTMPLGTPSASSGWAGDHAGETAEYYGVIGSAKSAYGVFALSATPSSQPAMYWNAAENKIASTHRVADVSRLPVLAGTWVKMLDGASLQDMVDDGYEISAYMCGSSAPKTRVYPKGFQSFVPPGETAVSNAICWFAVYDGGHTKSVAIEMETRDDGVYVKRSKGQYLYNKNNTSFKFAWLDDEGNPVYDCDQANKTAAENTNVATTWDAAGYGIAGLKASRYMKKNESRLVFRNPAGEPVLTLDDIKDHYLGCSFAAASISNADGEGVGLHRAFEYDGDSVRSMRVEYQVYDGGWNKCVVVDFTNGVDGVYGYAVAAGHYGRQSGVLGHNFVDAGGAFVDCTDAVVTAYDGASGYGIYDLFAAPMVVLERDTDWSGTGGTVPLGEAVVDLNGHNLTLQGVSGDDYAYAPYSRIFNSAAGTVAELRFDVPAGRSFANETVRIGTSAAFCNDNIKVVKKGRGTHVASLKQVYKGGTEIAGGVLKAGIVGSHQPFGASGGVVRVSAGGVLDWNGNYDFTGYPAFALDGGVIRNTGAGVDDVKAIMKGAALSVDSRFDATATWGFINVHFYEAALDLAGHTLDVSTYSGKSMYFTNVRATGGRINAHGGGVLEVRNNNNGIGFVGLEVDLTVSCELRLIGPMTVSNYTAAAVADGANVGTGALKVCGTFKPTTKYFRGCEMQDGSTMDFSEWPDGQPVASAYTCSGTKTISFADGATVSVSLGGKKFAGGKVVAWDAKPSNIGSVSFRSAEGERKYSFAAKDDGLYAEAHGFVVIVR